MYIELYCGSRENKMKTIAKVGGLIAILLSAYIYSAPYLFLYRLNQHLESKNYSAISEVVDFEAVQKSFELQIETKGKVTEFVLQKSIERYLTPQGLEELLSSPVLARKTARKELKKQLDQMKKDKKALKKTMKEQLQQLRKERKEGGPEAEVRQMRRKKRAEQNELEQILPSDKVEGNVLPAGEGRSVVQMTYELGYRDLNRFELELYNEEERFVQLVLYRSGLSWKLSELWLFFIFDKVQP